MLGIVGAGAMGSALAIHLARIGREVAIFATEFDRTAIAAHLNGDPHPALGVALPDCTIVEPDSWDDVLPKVEVAFLAVATAGLVPVSHAIARTAGGDCLFAIATKGWDEETLRSAAAVVGDEIGDPGRVVALVGPSLAVEIARGVPTGLVCASSDLAAARTVAETVAGGAVRTFISDDIAGVEVGAVCKNVVAIAVGMCEGLAPAFGVEAMTNACSFVFAQGLMETARLARALGGRAETSLGLTGAGDLYVTALAGRNARFGRLVGAGRSPSDALTEMATTVEGYANARAVVALAQRAGVTLPVIEMVERVVHGGQPAEEALRALMRGPVEVEQV